jgi:hypothetical protein
MIKILLDFPAPTSRFTAPATPSEAEAAGPPEPRLPLRMNAAYAPGPACAERRIDLARNSWYAKLVT